MARSRAPIRLVTVLSRSTAMSRSNVEQQDGAFWRSASWVQFSVIARSGGIERDLLAPDSSRSRDCTLNEPKKKRRNKINHTSLDIALCPSWETEVRDIHREGKSSIMIQRIPHWIDQYVGSAIRWDRRKEFLRSLPSRENSSPRVRDAPRRAVR